jgi:hypothetical protein
MGFLLDESIAFAFSSTLDIEFLNNTFFSYHVVGLVLGCSHKSLMLVYMYTRPSTQFDVKQFCFWYGQMNMNSNFVCTMIRNILAPKCNRQWVQMCVTSSNQIPPLVLE